MLAIKLWSVISGSWLAKWAVIVSVGLFAWWGNNAIQRSVGEKRGIAKVVKKANTKAKERNAKVRKIGDSIDPATAMQRLRSEYPNTDSN